MNNWSMEEFVRNLKSYLADADEELETETGRIMSVDGKNYTGLILKRKGMNVSPVLNLADAYKRYGKGVSLEEIALQILAQMERLPDMQAEAQNLMDYEKVKNRFYIRVSNAEWDRDVLEQVPHRQVADLALTCHIQIGSDASTMVTDRLLENYGITADQLFEDAFRNTELLKPVSIMTLGEAMKELTSVEADTAEDSPVRYVRLVTNSERVNGAAALFYPGIMERIQRAVGDYYVLPSSRHEVLIHPKTICPDPEGLAAMVREINQEAVSEEDRLSDHVYLYQAETGKLTLAAM